MNTTIDTPQAEATTKVKLSCNHVIHVDGHPSAGDLHQCPRCTASANGKPRRRRIRQVLAEAPTVVTAAAADAADDFIDAVALATMVDLPTLFSRIRGLFNLMAAEYLEQAAADLREFEDRAMAPVPEPTPAAVAEVQGRIEVMGNIDGTTGEVRTYDVNAASREWQALKAWREAGRVGEPPSTDNLTALNGAHAAGKPRGGKAKKATPGSGRGRATHARRAEANAIKAQGKRGAGRKVTDEELSAYVAKVKAAGHGTTGNDELEYAYWVEGLAVTRKRWNTAWAADAS